MPSDRAVTTVGVDEDDDDVLAAGLDSAGGLNADLNDDCIGLGCAGGGKPRSAWGDLWYGDVDFAAVVDVVAFLADVVDDVVVDSSSCSWEDFDSSATTTPHLATFAV